MSAIVVCLSTKSVSGTSRKISCCICILSPYCCNSLDCDQMFSFSRMLGDSMLLLFLGKALSVDT